jgi:putative ABC transport system permease protein
MSVRPLARLAWRDVRRRPLRTAMIALLIAVPFAGMLALNLAIANAAPHVAFEMGQANAVVQRFGFDSELPLPEPLRPGDVVIDNRVIPADVGGEMRAVDALVGELDSPVLRGKYEYRDGRAPASADEVAISEGWQRKHGASVGDSIVLGVPGTAHTVVGVYVDRSQLQPVGLQLASTDLGYSSGSTLYSTATGDEVVQSGSDMSVQFRGQGAAALDPAIRFAVHTGSLVALMAIGLLIAAAFASGARRQLREVGLISANGADPRHVRTAFSLQGTMTGVVGVLLGAGLFAVVAAVFADAVRWAVGTEVILRFSVPDLVLSLVSIIGAATLAAWWSARSVARTPVLAALSGRKPLHNTPARVPVAGLVVAVVGVVLLGQGADSQSAGGTLGGAALLVSAVALGSSWMVSVIGGAAARTGGALRIVGRAVARQRTRTGPLVAAMAVIGALGVLVVVATESEAASAGQDSFAGDGVVSLGWQRAPGDQRVRDDLDVVRRIVPDATQLVRVDPALDRPDDSWVNVAGTAGASVVAVVFVDPELSTLSDAAKADLRNGKALLVGAGETSLEIRATLENEESTTTRDLGTVMLPLSATDEPALVSLPFGEIATAFVDKSVLAKLGLEVGTWLSADVVKPGPLTAAENDALYALGRERSQQAELERAITGDVSASDAMSVGIGIDPAGERSVMRWIMIVALGLVGVLLLAAVAFGMSLSRIEQRDDQALLEALGAPPGFRRRSAGLEAAMLCAMAMAVAVPLGVVTGFVIRRSISTEAVAVPIMPIAALAIGMPLFCGLAFGLLNRGHRALQLSN